MMDVIDREAALAAVEEVRLESVLAGPLVDRRAVRKALRNVPAVQADDAPAIASADAQTARTSDFPRELESLLNRYSMESGSDSPDFVLAAYLVDCLAAFDRAVKWRQKWHGLKSRQDRESAL